VQKVHGSSPTGNKNFNIRNKEKIKTTTNEMKHTRPFNIFQYEEMGPRHTTNK